MLEWTVIDFLQQYKEIDRWDSIENTNITLQLECMTKFTLISEMHKWKCISAIIELDI